ncbi:hypothetical protein MUS1_01705 [Marinomonas ushuaiensis DSM 15871]|uniref:DUF2848 domain-containing protein n=1 Tax=Marinomonas ushuaiensis DSM 15871 TaxID=1122207 RepID=X7E921_9GAMM|nr:DUF2848 domain-containing protein [Marinomonas ushuaiensis]ETX12340.1 hypothetical protein MUS1_01705 [Marinomonas ushuaiensis DSM 15871]
MLFTVNGSEQSIEIKHLVVAGWTARNMASVQEHIDELAEIGVAPPSTVPLFYRASNLLVTQESIVEVLSADTSGEVEPLIIKADGKFYLGIGSDHTDRKLEAYSVAHSKQVSAKPVSTELWDFEEVAGHLDDLLIESWVDEGEGWVQYQKGSLANIRPLTELIEKGNLAEGSAMLCGTCPAIGGVRRTEKFKMSIHDPILSRTIECVYTTKELPIVS